MHRWSTSAAMRLLAAALCCTALHNPPTCTGGSGYVNNNKDTFCFCDDAARPNIDCERGGTGTHTGKESCETADVDATCTCKTTCNKGQYVRESACSCQNCGSNTYQDNEQHRSTTCTPQDTCGQGNGFNAGARVNSGYSEPGSCSVCEAGGMVGKYQDGTSHREACKDQRTCRKGFKFSGDNTVRGTCTTCGAGKYQDINGGRVTVCKPQKTCPRGEKFEEVSKGDKSWEGRCIACGTGTFIDQDNHREKTCGQQIKCQPGDIFRSTAQTNYGDCDQKCQGDTYQAKRDHRERTCDTQATCGKGTKISAYTIKAIRTCPVCDPDTYRDSAGHRFTACVEQQFCGKGQKISTDTKTARRTCPGCGSNSYQDSGKHRSTACEPQEQCTSGQRINKDSTTEIRKCSACPANTYRTDRTHREMVCDGQPTCNEGQYITPDTFTSRRVCQTCVVVDNSLTYQTKRGHRELKCIKQTTCPKGQRLDTIQNTKKAVCQNCIAGEFQPESNYQKDSCTRCGLNGARVGGNIECSRGEYLSGECNRAVGDSLQCKSCAEHEYGDTVHAAIVGDDLTKPDGDRYPCKPCDIVCPKGKFPRYDQARGTCAPRSTSNHATCVECSAGMWGLGTRDKLAKYKDNAADWNRELAWCQVCGTNGEVDNSKYQNVFVEDVDRLQYQDLPASDTNKYGGKMFSNPGFYQTSPGQGQCEQCQDFCPRGEKTTKLCTKDGPRVCNDEIKPQLCTTAALWSEPWKGPLAPWKGPLESVTASNPQGDCAKLNTDDTLEFEAVLDPFEIADVPFYTRSTPQSAAGFDPTTCFDPKDEKDSDLTRTNMFTRTSRTNKFIDPAFPYTADMTVLGNHEVDYTCKDFADNVIEGGALRYVLVKDTVAPTLVLCSCNWDLSTAKCKDVDDAFCGNAMPTDKECPLQHGSKAAGIWKSWVGEITPATDNADTEFRFDVSLNVVVGARRQQLAEASYKVQRDRTDLAWIAACDVCDRKATAGRRDGGFGNGQGKCGNSAATTATTIVDDNSIETVTNRIADWTSVKSFYTDKDRPVTGEAEIVYTVKDSSNNEGSISRKVILYDGTEPELFPYTGPDPDPENPTFEKDPRPYNNPEILEAIAKGTPTTYADYGARIEDVVEAELDQVVVLQVRSGAVRGDGDQELAQTEGEAFDLSTVSSETPWKDGVAGVTNARVGRYKVEYSAADSAGNVGTAERWVVVEDTTPPEITVEWPAKDGVHGPGVNGTDAFMSIPNLGKAGWVNFGVPWEEPDVTVADTHLPEEELRKTVEIWTSNSANTSAPPSMCCKGWFEECTQRANLTKCVDTELLEAGVPAIGMIYTLIYKMTDYSKDDALLVPGRTPNVAPEKKRTVVISDRLPPILELQTGAALGFEDVITTTSFTIYTHVGKLNKKKEDKYDDSMDGKVVIHGGYVYLDPTLSLEDAEVQNPRAAIEQVFDCTVVKGKDRGDCEKGINFVPTADCSTNPGRCAPRLIAPFEDPGFTFTDKVDTHNGAAKLKALTNGGLEMVSTPDLEKIKALCKRSRKECSMEHRNKAYVGGLREAGYLPAPGEQVGSTDLTANFTVAGVFTLEYAMIDANGNLGSATRTITVVRDKRPTRYKFGSYNAWTSTFDVDLQSGGGVITMVIILIPLLIILVVCYFSRERLLACISCSCKGGAAAEQATTELPSTTTNPTFAFEAAPAASAANSSQLAKKNAKSKGKQPARNGKGTSTGNDDSAPPPPPPEVWFHGEISRKEAEKRIRAASPLDEGVYLVRTKTDAGGESYVLSLRSPLQKMVHYVVKVPQTAGDELTIQTKPINLPWVKSLRDLVVHLQTATSKLVATKLKHPAPIPSNGPALMVQAAAQSASSGQTVEEKVYAMISDDPETFSINETYFGHPTGVYYRMFYPLERVEPLEVYTRQGESGGLPDGSSTDVFQVVDYKSKRTQQRLHNVPLYVRVSPEDLGPHIGLNEDALVLNMDMYEQPNAKQMKTYDDIKEARAAATANYEEVADDSFNVEDYDAMGGDDDGDYDEIDGGTGGNSSGYSVVDASEESRLGLDYSSLKKPKVYGSGPPQKSRGKAKAAGRNLGGAVSGTQSTQAAPQRPRSNTQFGKKAASKSKSKAPVLNARPRANTDYENTRSVGTRPTVGSGTESNGSAQSGSKLKGRGIRQEHRKPSLYLGFGRGGDDAESDDEIDI